MEIDEIVQHYILARKTDYAIMIDGEWGAGKSWYWENVLAKMISKIPSPADTNEEPSTFKAVKISLFGISTPDELRLRLFEETHTAFKNKYVKAGLKFAGFAFNKAAGFFNISETSGKDVSDIFSDFTVDLSDYVLCFDDLERIKLSILIELLGYINSLIEQYNVKVVFICNEAELKNLDYHKYKEKIVRFTHTIVPDISQMACEFAKDRKNGYASYLRKKKTFISSIYQKGKCSNLRTLKYNIDIFEHIFYITKKATRHLDKQHVEDVTNYMLLLSAIYSIEYRREHDDNKLKSLIEIDRQWCFRVNAIDSLKRQADNNQLNREKQKATNNNSESEIVTEYQQRIKETYFSNTYIYGSSKPIIDYLLTGYCDDDALAQSIKSIQSESMYYETSKEKQLYQSLTQFWDTDDDVMKDAVESTISIVKNNGFVLQDYPLFFLALQRLQIFGFIELPMTAQELIASFNTAIDSFRGKPFIESLDTYYRIPNEFCTPEYKEMVRKTKEVNSNNYTSSLIARFQEIVNDSNSIQSLREFNHLQTNLFCNITAKHFFEMFISYRNSRKRDYWNFFDSRYEMADCYIIEKEFVSSLRTLLKQYLSNPSVKASGTRNYCSNLLELLENRSFQFDDIDEALSQYNEQHP